MRILPTVLCEQVLASLVPMRRLSWMAARRRRPHSSADSEETLASESGTGGKSCIKARQIRLILLRLRTVSLHTWIECFAADIKLIYIIMQLSRLVQDSHQKLHVNSA